jgi:predicted RNase H-like nuclease
VRTTRYLGLDLAWAPRNSSGGAVLEPTESGGVRLVSTTHLRSHEDVLAWVARNRGKGQAIMAVNAPLIVENSGGQRPCDRLLHDHFSRYQVDDYQANIVSAGHPRTMGRAMMRMGFDPDPQAEGDRIIETYTQPAQILLFEQDRPIRVKHGPMGARKDAVERYREMIELHLTHAGPALEAGSLLLSLFEKDLSDMTGTRLGEMEEKLEAILCAWIAAYLDLRGPDTCAFLGDLEQGYVLLPTTARPTTA